MMKWLIVTLTVAFGAGAAGCSREPSSEGTIVRLVFWRLQKDAPPEAITEAEDSFRTIPSKVPIIERFEWGRAEPEERPHDRIPPVSHVWLVTFKDAQSAFDRAYEKAVDEAAGEDHRAALNTHVYQLHDATPRVRSTTHGKVRRVILFSLKQNTTREEMQKVEEALSRLPAEIPAITRLEWGTQTDLSGDPTKPKPIDTNFRNGNYCLLLTFNSTSERDACLAHPAYKEFRRMLEPYEAMGSAHFGWDYVAQVERIAR